MRTARIPGLKDIKTVKDIKTFRGVKCPVCAGTGIAETRLRCLVCGGSGFLRDI
jgi:DnaJ-class molecular chaperone